MAGGAQMFAFSSQSDTMRIGPRNAESCKEMLKNSQYRLKLKIRVQAMEELLSLIVKQECFLFEVFNMELRKYNDDWNYSN